MWAMVAAMMLVGVGEEAAAVVHAGMVVSAGCLNGCRLRTAITGSSTQTELTTISSQSMMRSGA